MMYAYMVMNLALNSNNNEEEEIDNCIDRVIEIVHEKILEAEFMKVNIGRVRPDAHRDPTLGYVSARSSVHIAFIFKFQSTLMSTLISIMMEILSRTYNYSYKFVHDHRHAELFLAYEENQNFNFNLIENDSSSLNGKPSPYSEGIYTIVFGEDDIKDLTSKG